MELTAFVAKIVGPVLVLRAVSIAIDRRHFVAMVAGLEREVTTVAFSLFPVALLMVCTTLVATHDDWSSPAAVLIHLMAWGGIAKASVLILFPHALVAKARALERAGFLNVVLAVCLVVGAYFTWFGWVASAGAAP